MAQAAHQEREAFEQTLDVRIAIAQAIEAEGAGTIRKRPRELLAGLAQVAHFRVVVAEDLVVLGWTGHKRNKEKAVT